MSDGAVTVPPLPGGDLSPEEHATTGRGELRIYLGAAPGVGKTYAMLNEGRRRRDRGTDVVVGFVETYGRQHTAAELRRPGGRPAATDE